MIIGKVLYIFGLSGSYYFLQLVRDLYCSPKFFFIKNHWILAAVIFLPIVSYNCIRSHAIRKCFWDLAQNMNEGVGMVSIGGGVADKGTGGI